MPIFKKVGAGLLSVLLAASPASVLAQEADTVYVNGTVYTVNEVFGKSSAFAVKDGAFIYVGDDAGARAHVGPLTFVVDLEGKTVIPGLARRAHPHPVRGKRTVSADPGHPGRRSASGQPLSACRKWSGVRWQPGRHAARPRAAVAGIARLDVRRLGTPGVAQRS